MDSHDGESTNHGEKHCHSYGQNDVARDSLETGDCICMLNLQHVDNQNGQNKKNSFLYPNCQMAQSQTR